MEAVGPLGEYPGSDAVAEPDRVRLLFRPCKARLLKRGDRAICLLRDCAVDITN